MTLDESRSVERGMRRLNFRFADNPLSDPARTVFGKSYRDDKYSITFAGSALLA